MPDKYINHQTLVRFADSYVNLKQEDSAHYREQVNRLRKKLEDYIKEHPDFSLRKMMLAGSLAKHTSLKTLNDIDVAVYLSPKTEAKSLNILANWLEEKLKSVFANIKSEQIRQQEFSVQIVFSGTGLHVDIVPIILEASSSDNEDGYLISGRTGEKVWTNIHKHLEFIKKRRIAHPKDYAQIVRFIKFWVKGVRKREPRFQFKSFLIELIVAYLADKNLITLSDYPEALLAFFNFIFMDEFKTTIAFSDYYDSNLIQANSSPIQIYDPVNYQNNVAKEYTKEQRQILLDEATKAAEAIEAANYAPTKERALYYWQKIFGSVFGEII